MMHVFLETIFFRTLFFVAYASFFELAIKVGAVCERLGVDEQVAGAHLHRRNDDDRAAAGHVSTAAAAANAAGSSAVPFGGGRAVGLWHCQFGHGFAVRVAENKIGRKCSLLSIFAALVIVHPTVKGR